MSWFWQADDGWKAYSPEDAEKLEDAREGGRKRCKLSATYTVDLEDMVQVRNDDTTRQRPVKREDKKRAADDDGADAAPAKKKARADEGPKRIPGAVRLQKDLISMKNDPESKGRWSVELVEDDLQHWEVRVFEFDESSQLHKDLQQYKRAQGVDHVKLWFKFPDSYPIDPPFVMIRSPKIQGGSIFNGGLCVDVLMQNWVAGIRPESLMLQIRQLLMEGHAHITGPGEFGEKEARAGFDMAKNAHKNDPNFSK
eukprot:m51a1_g8129 putative ubiquitin-conjugating enzyme e2 q1 (254) ;mRNA; f:207641-209033